MNNNENPHGNIRRMWLAIAAIVLVAAAVTVINIMIPYNAEGKSSTQTKQEANAELKTNANSSTPAEAPVKDAAKLSEKPQIEVPYDLKTEEQDQKSVDEGHSPWRLDPIFVAQVFASLKISPQGIVGDYPISREELKVTKIDDRDAAIEVSGNKTLVRKVYLKRLVRQDSTGIWTVVGYDPVDKK